MSSYSHAGVSKLNGEFKVRFCNDALRVKVLAKNGHKDIDIIELKTPMTKEAAVAYLLSIDFDNGNKTIRAALEAAADKRGVTAPVAKAAPKAKAKKTTVADTVMAEAKSKAKKAVPQPMMTTAEAQVKIMEQVGEALM
jgi:hypothetical protein